jgi:hypothetical protein
MAGKVKDYKMIKVQLVICRLRKVTGVQTIVVVLLSSAPAVVPKQASGRLELRVERVVRHRTSPLLWHTMNEHYYYLFPL